MVDGVAVLYLFEVLVNSGILNHFFGWDFIVELLMSILGYDGLSSFFILSPDNTRTLDGLIDLLQRIFISLFLNVGRNKFGTCLGKELI